MPAVFFNLLFSEERILLCSFVKITDNAIGELYTGFKLRELKDIFNKEL
jgi:hypothetical protein